MSDKHKKLQEKIEEFNMYLDYMGFEKRYPDKYYNDPSIDRLAKELYTITQDCGSFNSEKEIDLRNQSLALLQFVKVLDDVRDAEEAMKLATSDEEKAKCLVEFKNANLKYNCAMAGVDDKKPLSQSIDINQITWAQTSSAETIQESFDSVVIEKAMKKTLDPKTAELFNKSFGKGGLSTFASLIPNTDGKGYKIDSAITVTNAMKKLLADSRMQAMCSSYQKAEKAWLITSNGGGEEIENRLRFTNTYDEELKSLYFCMTSVPNRSPEVLAAMNKVLEDAGIRELLKDYKAFKDPENTKTEFLNDDANEIDNDFRKQYKEFKEKVDNLTDNNALRDVHKYFLKHGDYGTGVTGDVTNIDKQARPFIENFMAMPEKDQLKSLYMLENKLYKKDVEITDEMLKDYKPNVKNISKVLTATPLKFWKRANSTYMYWQKLKTCQNKVQDKELNKQKPDKFKKIAKVVKKVTTVGNMVARLGFGSNTAGNVLLAAGAVVGSAAAIKKIADEKDLTSGAQKADAVLSEVGNLAKTAQMATIVTTISTKSFQNIPVIQGLAVATNAIATGKSISNLATSKKNVKKVAELGNDIQKLMKKHGEKMSPEQKQILEKLETSTRVLKVINRDKVKINTAETVKNATALTCSTAMVSGLGFVALVPQAVVGLGTKIAESVIKKNNTNDVIDAKLYKNEEEKQQKLAETNTELVTRYGKLPKKLQDKYMKDVANVYNDKKKLEKINRLHAVKKSGQINLASTKNSYIRDIGNDIYKLLKSGAEEATKNEKLSEIDKAFVDIAKKFVKATGGKEIDLKNLQVGTSKEDAMKQKTVDRLVENMTL